MGSIHFKLVTPEKTVLSQELVSLSCPTAMGEITILPGHIPLVANLVPGELHARSASGDSYIFVSGGFIEINPGSEVIVLADAAEHHHEIDEARAEEARKRAEKTLAEEKLSDEEYASVTASLDRSLTRLRVLRKRGRHARSQVPTETPDVP